MEWMHDGEAVSVLDFRSNFQWKIRGLPGGGGGGAPGFLGGGGGGAFFGFYFGPLALFLEKILKGRGGGAGGGGGGVLTYVSDGEVRRPFLGLNLATLAFFVKEHFQVDYFGQKDSGRTFLRLDEPGRLFYERKVYLKDSKFCWLLKLSIKIEVDETS